MLIVGVQAAFMGVTIGACTAAVVTVVAILGYARWKRILIFVPHL
jgi:hypothetical protein